MEQLFSLGEVARHLEVQGYQIAYAISTGAIADVACRVANKRCFTIEDVARVARHFGLESRILGVVDVGQVSQ